MKQLPKRTPLDEYLFSKKAPYFRSEPFKQVMTYTKEEEKEGLSPDIIKFENEQLNKDNVKDYKKYLLNYKKEYDAIFEDLPDPDEKEQFKYKVVETLKAPTKNPDYEYAGFVNDLIEQINKEYDLYKKEPESVNTRSKKPVKTFLDFINNVTDEEAFANELKDTFKTEKGQSIKVIIDSLKTEGIIIQIPGEFKNLCNSIGVYFDRSIGEYQGINDAKSIHSSISDPINQKLKPLITKYKKK